MIASSLELYVLNISHTTCAETVLDGLSPVVLVNGDIQMPCCGDLTGPLHEKYIVWQASWEQDLCKVQRSRKV